MNRRAFVRLGVTAAAVGTGVLPVRAQSKFPEHPIEIIVPFGVGGGTDIWMRIMAKSMSQSLGVPVNVINIPGAASLRGTGEGALVKPDGYKLTAFNPPSTPFAWYLMKSQPFDIRAFKGLTVYVREPGIIVAHPDAGINTIEDVKKAYNSGAKTVIGSQQRGTLWHIAALLLQKRCGINWKTYVSYKGTADVAAALLRREIEVGIVTSSSAIDHVREGQLKPIVLLGSTERIKAFPNTPTMKEAGYDPLEVCALLRAVYAPKGTPDDRVAILEKALLAAQDASDLKAQYAALGLEPIYGNGGEADRAIVDALAIADEIKLKEITE
jgi:tripartite-type tricarboxylate transporter receptor subunit TctC